MQTSQAETSSKPSFILADVHLMPNCQDPINQAFQAFLTNQAKQADEIYILGDLFETWVGDDISLELYQTEISLLKNLTDQGIKLYISYGNRDFLMGEKFWQATGAEFLPEIVCKQIKGLDLILLHGDLLCTDDKQYQKMRKLFNQDWLQWILLHLPKFLRLKIAGKLRQQSAEISARKPKEIMDVNQNAVLDLFAKYPQAKQMIHGHTHRPAVHQIKDKQRFVLGDWRPAGELIKISNQQIQLLKPEELTANSTT